MAMIKSLLDDENQPLEEKPEIKTEQVIETRFENSHEMNAEPSISNIPELNTEQVPANSSGKTDSDEIFNFHLGETLPRSDDKPMFQTDFKPESLAETARKSGLAYAAGIALFGSIVFLMGLGWFVDLLLGISPWGIVGGIILGSVIGFIQFFRITSQILKDNKDR
jgi:F0F1-type ATP synthase assembly protein I